MIQLNTKSVESAFALKAREFAKDAANIFWLRDIELPDNGGINEGLPFVPNEQELAQFCESLGVTLCRNFDLSLDDESNMLYASLAASSVTAYLRVAPLNNEDKSSPVIVDIGFLLAISSPSLMPVEVFLPQKDSE